MEKMELNQANGKRAYSSLKLINLLIERQETVGCLAKTLAQN